MRDALRGIRTGSNKPKLPAWVSLRDWTDLGDGNNLNIDKSWPPDSTVRD